MYTCVTVALSFKSLKQGEQVRDFGKFSTTDACKKSMLSKTMLVGLCIFRCDRLCWESERTKKFAAWCIGMCQGNAVNERAGECGVVRFMRSTKFFVLDKAHENRYCLN